MGRYSAEGQDHSVQKVSSSWVGWAGPSLETPSPSTPECTGTVPECREKNEKLPYQMLPVPGGDPGEDAKSAAPFPHQGQGHLSEMSSKGLTGAPLPPGWNNSEVHCGTEVPSGPEPQLPGSGTLPVLTSFPSLSHLPTLTTVCWGHLPNK